MVTFCSSFLPREDVFFINIPSSLYLQACISSDISHLPNADSSVSSKNKNEIEKEANTVNSKKRHVRQRNGLQQLLFSPRAK
ncbi:hypothetical protein TNCV_56081 [Trichonephila clavipes]|nr:hypothetical protein TNCV_56081 [Trichonephila clavipes]